MFWDESCSGSGHPGENHRQYAKLTATMQNSPPLCKTHRHYAKLTATMQNSPPLCKTHRHYAKLTASRMQNSTPASLRITPL
jgi:ubiquitin